MQTGIVHFFSHDAIIWAAGPDGEYEFISIYAHDAAPHGMIYDKAWCNNEYKNLLLQV